MAAVVFRSAVVAPRTAAKGAALFEVVGMAAGKDSPPGGVVNARKALYDAGVKVLLAEIAFRTLRGLLAPTRGSRRRPTPAALKRLLLVNRLRIGDSVVTTPFLAHARENLPGAEITLLVSPPIEELFLDDPRMDVLVARRGGRIEAVRGKWKPGFDAAVILDPTLRSGWIARRARARWVAGYDSHARGVFLDACLPAPPYWNRPLRDYRGRTDVMHQADAWMRLSEVLGLPPGSRAPWVCVADTDREWARAQFAKSPGAGPAVVLHPGSDPSYRWPADRWAAVAAALAKEDGARLAVTGSAADRPLAEEIVRRAEIPARVLAGETTLGRVAAVIAESRLVVSVDTSATHLASAVGTPCVALFGAGDPDIWRPWGEGHAVLRTEEALPCLGCKRPTCALETHKCMEGIAAERVLRTARGILARRPAATGS